MVSDSQIFELNYFPSYLQAQPTIQELQSKALACVTGKMAEAPGLMWPGLAHT